MTWAGVITGYLDSISAATPATSAHAGLVPSTVQYRPSRPCAGTACPGAATLTERLLLEKLAAVPLRYSAPTPMTPGYSAGKDTGANPGSRRASSRPELPDEATSTTLWS